MRVNQEPAGAAAIDQGCKNCWRVEVREGHEVNRAILTNQCDSMQVANQSVVLDWLVIGNHSRNPSPAPPVSPPPPRRRLTGTPPPVWGAVPGAPGAWAASGGVVAPRGGRRGCPPV